MISRFKPIIRLQRLTKAQIRSKILFRLKTQKEDESKRKSQVIKDKLFKLRDFKEAKTVMFYIALGEEVNTEEMIKQAKKLGKKIAVPVCQQRRSLRPARFNPGACLARGPYGICEPAVKKWISVQDLDFVVVPGIAFDKHGNRLGHGKGYYDNFLRRLNSKTATCGLAFDFQILPFLPTSPKDVSVQRVISN